MSQEGAAERLSTLRDKLVERVTRLSASRRGEGHEAGASDSVDECVRCVRSALSGLPDQEALTALLELLESFEETLEGQLAHARDAKDPLTGQVLASRLWQRALFTRAPWCPVSERQLVYLTEELLQTLGLNSCGLSLWAEATPSCAPSLWVERGLSEALSGLVDQSDEEPSRVHGLMICGEGSSASLAWAHRALLAQGLQVIAPLPAVAPWSRELISGRLEAPSTGQQLGVALLIDDLHLADRPLIWALAELLSSDRRPDLLIWSGEQEGFSQALQGSIKAELHTLASWGERAWRQWSERAGGERPLSARSAHVRLTDQLRCSERAWLSAERGVVSMTSLPREEPFELIELLAAAVGPLVSTRAMVEAQEGSELSSEGQLTFAGFLQRGPSKTWGLLWEHARAAQWSEALAACSERLAEPGVGEEPDLRAQLSRLLRALQREELWRERWLTQGVIHRLHHHLKLRPEPLRAPPPTLDELKGGKQRLGRLMEDTARPHPLSLGVLCGLALDWAASAPQGGGHSAETFEVLQLGVSAAQRLGDPLRGGRLSLALGRLALYEGLSELAKVSLETASQLLISLRRPSEAQQALSAWAEAEVLSGELGRARALYGRAEEVMRQLSYEEGLWLLRFKRGQLARQMGDAVEALKLWAPLQIERGGASSEALLIELALAQLELDEPDFLVFEAHLSQLPSSPLKELMSLRATSLRGSAEGLGRGLELIIELNQRRAPGPWLTACELWSLSILEVDEAQGALEAASRMLEEAVKGAVAVRDRLRLTSLYALLSVCYLRRSMIEEARVARCFVEAWSAQLKGPLKQRAALRLSQGQLELGPVDEELTAQVQREVSLLLTRWRAPISALMTEAHRET